MNHDDERDDELSYYDIVLTVFLFASIVLVIYGIASGLPS